MRDALLDDFAKAAMIGLLSGPAYHETDEWEEVAHDAYVLATAMVEAGEREYEKPPPTPVPEG